MPTNEVPLFDPTLKIAVDHIEALSIDTLSRRHISGMPVMYWEPTATNTLHRYAFVSDDQLQLELHFSNPPHLVHRKPVLICLKGASIELRPTLKHPKVPFKLIFSEGVILQFNGQIRDTFPAEPPLLPPLPSWFGSQASPASSPPPTSPTHASSSPHKPSSPTAPSKPNPSSKRGASRTPSDTLPQKQPRAPAPPRHSYAPPRPESSPVVTRERNIQGTQDISTSDIRQQPATQTSSIGQGDNESEAPSASNSMHKSKKKRRRGKRSLAPEKNPALDMTAGCYSPLGGNYLPLADLQNNVGAKVSVMGVVRGISLPRLARTGDWFVSTELLDPTTTEQTAFKTNMFLPESMKDCIPSVKAGDIFMIRKLTICRYNNVVVGTGYSDSFQWAGYSPSEKVHFHSTRRTFSDEEHCPFFTPGDEELQYAARLADWWSALQELAKSKPDGVPTLMSQPKGRSLITLSEAKADVFFNCVVEILYTLPPGDQCAEIFITDYTINNQFFTRRPPQTDGAHDKTKVYGKRVLKVVLWGDTQITHARELETPGYYFIDNLRVRFDSKGFLEGTLQDNRRKIDKLRSDDPLLPALLQRRQEYIDKPPSQEGETSRRGADGRDANLYCAGDLLPPPLPIKRTEPKQQGPEVTRLRFYNIVRTPIQKILGHPICPDVFRIKGRIVAFEPYKLENFSIQPNPVNQSVPSQYNGCFECTDFDLEYVVYEYRFQMVVEEESSEATGYRGTLIVDVSGEEAEHFLSGLPPADFQDRKNVTKLRQRMAPILGNLEVYQQDLMTGNSLKAITRGRYFDMLIHSHLSEHKNEGALDNKRYRLWGTELTPTSVVH
ncbi:telomeric single stranded DNA-binding POT1/CDC13 protein [Rhizoctonia solani]|uniref:Protection of telomeres protein 1 n=1 Tax=Rhizoctonia solani TaxID=456999 RepID=A0A8H8T1X6_9AGAM|nr:telomeric single stranded DNA-binding POT1/CDC13 protein [Rhizoctonia solani]QRW26921.1 telomeric single stranded DNA-binding POT1/CDC13 protein [Rhizoctonia solani]